MDPVSVKKFISSYNLFYGKYKILKRCIDNHDTDREAVKNEINQLELYIEIIRSCLHILTAEERFIIQLHLIQQFNWRQRLALYEQHSGKSCCKSDRTLKRIQSTAINKITRFMERSDIEQYVLSALAAWDPPADCEQS